jgi:hypothetical protein
MDGGFPPPHTKTKSLQDSYRQGLAQGNLDDPAAVGTLPAATQPATSPWSRDECYARIRRLCVASQLTQLTHHLPGAGSAFDAQDALKVYSAPLAAILLRVGVVEH